MLTEFRDDVYQTLLNALLTVPVWDVLPDDTAELPCVVVGRPEAIQTTIAVVFDLTCDVWIIGRRQHPGEAEKELVALADDVLTALGGTRAVRTPSREVLAVSAVESRVLQIAGLDCDAYLVTASASATTC